MLQKSRWITCLAVLAVCGTAFAQPGGGGGGRGGRGGGGMFGGGGGTRTHLQVLGAESVQNELGLSDEQKKAVGDLNAALRAQLRGSFGGQDQSQEERRANMAKMVEATRKAHEEIKPKIAEALDGAQFKRLQQITWQANGAAALQDEDLAKELQLTQEQKDTIAATTKEYNDQAMAAVRGGGERRDAGQAREAMAQRREQREARDTKILGVLTPEQKTKFEELKGETFDVSSIGGSAGGRRGGEGGGFRGGEGGQRPEGGRRQRPDA